MKQFTKIKDFCHRQYVTFVVFYTTFLIRELDKCLQLLGRLQVLDLSQPLFAISVPVRQPVQQPVEPLTSDYKSGGNLSNRGKTLSIPYVPAWVSASFKDPTKHPRFSPTTKVMYPEVVLNATVETTETAPLTVSEEVEAIH